MIAVDTSAVVAILQSEPDAGRLHSRLAAANGALMSAGTVLELQLVIAGAGRGAPFIRAQALFDAYQIRIKAFDEPQLAVARDAAVRFGKGRHKARLNFGDCFAYALAKTEGLPLLCVGSDFAHTDIEIA